MGHQQGKRNNQVMADPFEKLSKTCDQGIKTGRLEFFNNAASFHENQVILTSLKSIDYSFSSYENADIIFQVKFTVGHFIKQ